MGQILFMVPIKFAAEIRRVIINEPLRLKLKKKFFGRYTKNSSWSAAFRNFLFYENIICFDWAINLFLSWVMPFVKTMSFPGVLINSIGLVPGPHPLLLITHCRFPWPWGQLKKSGISRGAQERIVWNMPFRRSWCHLLKWGKAV